MPPPPGSIKRDLEQACNKAADEVASLAPGEKIPEKLEKLLSEKVCKDIDKKILTIVAKELAGLGKKHSAKAPPNPIPRVNSQVSFKKPGSDSPSFTIPFPEIDLGGKTKGKFELDIWGDPRQFEKAEKGVMINFTVKFR
jgi:hypothetical protein